MEYKYKEWEENISAFKGSVEKELQEIRQCKAEMQQMRKEMAELINSGRYIRDDQRLILSAPEIIIGNVDPMGVLYNDVNSKIILRGTDVGLQAAGEYGQVEVRASNIREVAEDPGVDGLEHVVNNTSEIVSQARNIVIQSDKDEEAFSRVAKPEWDSGVYIFSDSYLGVRSLDGVYSKKMVLLEAQEHLNKRKKELDRCVKVHEQSFMELINEMHILTKEKNTLLKEKDDVRFNYNKLDWLNAQLDATMKTLAEESNSYGNILSELAEINRQINVFEQQSSELAEEDDFRKEFGSTSITIASEEVNFVIEDGDHNHCDKKSAGINMYANKINLNADKNNGEVSVSARDIKLVTSVVKDYKFNDGKVNYSLESEGNVKIMSKNIILESVDYEKDDNIYTEKQLAPESRIKLRSKTIELSTENAANMEYDNKGKITANYTADGDVVINSKNVCVRSLDYDLENGEVKNRELTKGSQVYVCTEKTEFSSTNADGYATGSFVANAKDIIIKSADVKADDRTDDAIAHDGSLSLMAENMNLWSVYSLDLQSSEIGIFAGNTVEAQQGDGKSAVWLSDGDIFMGGNKNQVVGVTEINGELKVPTATIDNLEVKTSLKTPNITDGMSVPGPSAGGISTKLVKVDIDEFIGEKQTEGLDKDSLNPFREE